MKSKQSFLDFSVCLLVSTIRSYLLMTNCFEDKPNNKYNELYQI